MAIVTLPSDLPLGAGTGIGQRRYDLVAGSDATGAQQARLLGPPRWTLTLVQPPALRRDGAALWQALIARLRGSVNHLAAWDPARPAPRGTLRGSCTLNSSAAAGATGITINAGAGQAGRTLRQGDWLQIGAGLGSSQLVMVVDDQAVDGAGLIGPAFEPPLRTGFAAGTVVTWDRPLAYYRLQTQSAGWQYAPGGVAGPVASGMALDLLEAWS